MAFYVPNLTQTWTLFLCKRFLFSHKFAWYWPCKRRRSVCRDRWERGWGGGGRYFLFYDVKSTSMWFIDLANFRISYHMTKSNIIISGEFLHKWMVMSGKECPTSDVPWQFTDHCACDSCPVIRSGSSSQFIHKNKGVSCCVSKNCGRFA